ncbi:hypothetical protein [Methylobacterium sp. Leaf85]|uniref:hypothetical protein n=1 Tax=Methylobacterium sp. Leaf85 TaxID=1736241 RepID=UPI0006FAD86C|nr:hypothetical protein [Methylobacterium sp. Leaf85]KQO53054.1 hypothetical protein ASF08_19205 [Methylobacterium sp. Leaf85]
MTGSSYYMKAEELIGAVGEDDAHIVMGRFGGTRFYVPAKPKDDSRLVKELGRSIADRLADFVATGIGGLYIDIPVGQASNVALYHRYQLNVVARSDLSEAELAIKLGVHGRTIRRMRAKLRREREAQAAKPLAIAG